jgi:hypothetical protein
VLHRISANDCIHMCQDKRPKVLRSFVDSIMTDFLLLSERMNSRYQEDPVYLDINYFPSMQRLQY